MQLIQFPRPRAVDILPQLSGDWTSDAAANDACPIEEDPTMRIHDINLLVAEVVGRVAARESRIRSDIELDLCPCVPEIAGDPQLTAFAIAGVLVAQLRTLDDGGAVRIKTEVQAQTVKVSILADGLPLLDFVRALEHDDELGDPTMSHCRRLVEQIGGWMQLRADDGLVGFELNFPARPLSFPVRLHPAVSVVADAAPMLALAS